MAVWKDEVDDSDMYEYRFGVIVAWSQQVNKELANCQESLSLTSQTGRITGCERIRLSGRSHTVGSAHGR